MTLTDTKIITTSCSVIQSSGADAQLTINYYIAKTADLSRDMCDYSEIFSFIVVGFEDGNISDSVFIYDVTRQEKTAQELILLLSENSVTPCCVKDVLEDIL